MAREISDKTPKNIENLYAELLHIIRDTKQDVSELKVLNSSLNTIKRTIWETLNAQIDLSVNELSKALNETVWDNLVIAFLGKRMRAKAPL